MEQIIMIIVAFIAAAIGSMGIGGGTVLLIYFACFTDIAQKTAQGINLLFFIPVAIVALVLHTKSKLINWKITLFTILPGIGGAFLGYGLSGFLDEFWLKKAFAVFLLLIGLRELLFTKKVQDP